MDEIALRSSIHHWAKIISNHYFQMIWRHILQNSSSKISYIKKKKKKRVKKRLDNWNVRNVLLTLESDSTTLLYFPQTHLKQGHKFACPRHTSNSLTWPCWLQTIIRLKSVIYTILYKENAHPANWATRIWMWKMHSG